MPCVAHVYCVIDVVPVLNPEASTHRKKTAYRSH